MADKWQRPFFLSIKGVGVILFLSFWVFYAGQHCILDILERAS